MTPRPTCGCGSVSRGSDGADVFTTRGNTEKKAGALDQALAERVRAIQGKLTGRHGDISGDRSGGGVRQRRSSDRDREGGPLPSATYGSSAISRARLIAIATCR